MITHTTQTYIFFIFFIEQSAGQLQGFHSASAGGPNTGLPAVHCKNSEVPFLSQSSRTRTEHRSD